MNDESTKLKYTIKEQQGGGRGKQRSYRMLYADVPYNSIKYGNPIKIKKSLKWQSMHQGEGGKGEQRERKQIFRIFRSYGLPSLAWICGIRQAKPPQPAGVASTWGNGAGAGVANVDKLRVRHVAQRKHHKNYFKSDAERFSGVDTTHTDMT